MALKTIVKLGYGLGHVTNDLCSALWFTYVLVYYELVLEFTTLYSGLIMLVGQIADAVATPIVGVICDRGPIFWKINLRRRKIWYLTGSIMVVLTFPFLFFDCYFCTPSENIRFIYYSFMVTIFQIAWAMVQIAHLAIAPDLTLDEKERTTLMSIRNTFTVLSALFIYMITYALFEFCKDNSEEKIAPEDKIYFQIAVVTSLIVGSITSLFFYITVHENTRRLKRSDSLEISTLTYKQLFCKISLYQTALVYMCSRIFCNVSQSLLPLYLNITLLLPKPAIASLPFVMYTSSFVSSLISAPLNDTVGRKFTYLIGVVLSFIASIWIKFDTSPLYKQYFIYIVTILIGFAASLLLVTALAITTDHIGSHLNNSAFLFGIFSFADKISCGVVIMIIQSIRSYYQDTYYRDALAAVCALSSIIGLITIVTIKKVKPAEIQNTSSNTLEGSKRVKFNKDKGSQESSVKESAESSKISNII